MSHGELPFDRSGAGINRHHATLILFVDREGDAPHILAARFVGRPAYCDSPFRYRAHPDKAGGAQDRKMGLCQLEPPIREG